MEASLKRIRQNRLSMEFMAALAHTRSPLPLLGLCDRLAAETIGGAHPGLLALLEMGESCRAQLVHELQCLLSQAGAPLSPAPAAAQHLPRVLLVDADPGVALKLAMALGERAELTVVGGCGEACALVDSGQYALLVLDPGQSGSMALLEMAPLSRAGTLVLLLCRKLPGGACVRLADAVLLKADTTEGRLSDSLSLLLEWAEERTGGLVCST